MSAATPARRHRREAPAMATRWIARAGWWIALVAIELNIGIHVALTPMHLEEEFYIGVLFTMGNAALFAAMLLLMSARLHVVGWFLAAATSAAEFGAFVASRTSGLPGGYRESWISAPEDLLGLVSLACEVVVIALALRVGLAGRRATRDQAADGRTTNGAPSPARALFIEQVRRQISIGDITR